MPNEDDGIPMLSESISENRRRPYGPEVPASDTGRIGEPPSRVHALVSACKGETPYRSGRRSTTSLALIHGESNLTDASLSGLCRSEDPSTYTPDTTQNSTVDDVPPQPETGAQYSPPERDNVSQPYRQIPAASPTAAERGIHRGTTLSKGNDLGPTTFHGIAMDLKNGTHHPRANDDIQQGETSHELQVLGTDLGRTSHQSNGYGSSLSINMEKVHNKSKQSSFCHPETLDRTMGGNETPPTRTRKRDWLKAVWRKAFPLT
jgi:hypothetical protein